MIETTGDLITFCLRSSGINGIGQTPLADDVNTGLQLLNAMLAQWQRRRWLVWDERETTAVSTGALQYTVGPGGDFDVPRPDRVENAFLRLITSGQTMPIDLPLSVIEAKEDYVAISIKNLQTLPAAVWYDPAVPMGFAHFWPVPPGGAYEMHLNVKCPLPVYTHLTDTLDGLPPEYMEALIWSLTVRLQMSYGMPARNDHVAAMRAALAVLRMANTQVPALSLPAALGGRGRGDLSSWSGTGLNQAWILNQTAVL